MDLIKVYILSNTMGLTYSLMTRLGDSTGSVEFTPLVSHMY